jgi:hypothetical protein
VGSNLRDQLMALAALRTRTVVIGGVSFPVREVGALEFAEYGKLQKTDKLKATASLIAACVVDDDGNPALTIEEATAIARSARVSMPIVGAVMELSGFGGEDAEKEPDAN